MNNIKKKIIFITGGARSGKSGYAVGLAKKNYRKVVFIATAEPGDGEMIERIRKHRVSRPAHWKVIEEGRDIGASLRCIRRRFDVVLIDCLGIWISNLMGENLKDREIEKKIKDFVRTVLKTSSDIIIVSNEVGSGIVPDNPLARRFRDLLGLANQEIAMVSDEVFLMISRIPVKIKGGRDAKAE